MPPLTAVSNGQLSDASMWNQYRSLFLGGHVFDAVAGYGADPTGVANSATAINSAITAAAGVGTVFIPAGTYLIDASLTLPDNTTLWMDPRAYLRRTFASAGTIVNSQPNSTGNTGITVIGGNLGLGPARPVGQGMALHHVTNLLILNVRIGDTAGGAWMCWLKEIYRAVIANCVFDNPAISESLNDGLHIDSGQYISVTNCYIKTADDAIALGNTSGTTNVTALGLRDVTVSNCTLYSGLSRGLAIFTEWNTESENIEISNCSLTGAGTGPALEITDYYNDNTYQATVNTDSPYLYWRLKETVGTTAADSSTNARPGTYSATGVTYAQRGGLRSDTSPSGSTNDAAHNYDNCVVLDGVNGTITRASVALGTSWSMECLFKGTAVPSGALTSTRIMSVGSNPMLLAVSDGTLQINDSAGHTLTTTKRFCDGAWHHIVATYNVTGTVSTIYVDGVVAATTTSQAFAAPSSATFAISPAGAMTPMAIDEVALYSSALSQAQVTAHFNVAMRARLVHNIHLSNISITSSSTTGAWLHRVGHIWMNQIQSTAGQFSVNDCEDVNLTDCFGVKTAGASTVLTADTISDFTLRGGTLDGQLTATVGIDAKYIARGNWLGLNVRNINGTGIQLGYSSGLKVVGNTIAFTVNPFAEYPVGTSHHNVIAENDFRDNSSGLGTAGVGSSYRNNLGYNVDATIQSVGNWTGTIIPDATNGDTILATLTGSITINTINGGVPGRTITLILVQDGTGGRTITYGTSGNVRGGGLTAATTTLNTRTIDTLIYDGTNWRASGRVTGQAA